MVMHHPPFAPHGAGGIQFPQTPPLQKIYDIALDKSVSADYYQMHQTILIIHNYLNSM
jgi:hypothetical protein